MIFLRQAHGTLRLTKSVTPLPGPIAEIIAASGTPASAHTDKLSLFAHCLVIESMCAAIAAQIPNDPGTDRQLQDLLFRIANIRHEAAAMADTIEGEFLSPAPGPETTAHGRSA